MSPEGLLPLLEQNYPECGHFFLPDLTAALYERETTPLLENTGVAFVPRGENPPGCLSDVLSRTTGAL